MLAKRVIVKASSPERGCGSRCLFPMLKARQSLAL
jgi:hypothetical protein